MNNVKRQKVPLAYVNKLGHYSLGHGLRTKSGAHLFFFGRAGSSLLHSGFL